MSIMGQSRAKTNLSTFASVSSALLKIGNRTQIGVAWSKKFFRKDATSFCCIRGYTNNRLNTVSVRDFKKTWNKKCLLYNTTDHGYILLPYMPLSLIFIQLYGRTEKKLAAHSFELVLGMILRYLKTLQYRQCLHTVS